MEPTTTCCELLCREIIIRDPTLLDKSIVSSSKGVGCNEIFLKKETSNHSLCCRSIDEITVHARCVVELLIKRNPRLPVTPRIAATRDLGCRNKVIRLRHSPIRIVESPVK